MSGDSEARELIYLGFAENLLGDDSITGKLKPMMGLNLRAALKSVTGI